MDPLQCMSTGMEQILCSSSYVNVCETGAFLPEIKIIQYASLSVQKSKVLIELTRIM